MGEWYARPIPARDVSAPLGSGLLAVDESSVAGLPGLVKVVVIGDFVGVVCEREEQAIRAARQLKVRWKDGRACRRWNPTGSRTRFAGIRRSHARCTTRPVSSSTSRASPGRCRPLMSGPTSCTPPSALPAPSPSMRSALASGPARRTRHDLRNDLARLLQRETGDIEVIRMEAAGCHGRNGADDVSADAVLLAQAVGRPVRVQLMREQEHGWEPKGTAQPIEVRGGLDE